MKKILIFLIMILTCASIAFAENQKYVVDNKDGKARFVPVENVDGKWKWVEPRVDIYLDNGVEVSGFKIESDPSLNYKGTKYVYKESIIVEHEGKHYVAVQPEKNLKLVDENGETTSGLGFRNYLIHTSLGAWYQTSYPGLLALLCTLISGIFLIWSIFKDPVPAFIRWGFAAPLCVISLLELGAFFSMGMDAAWWVNPDDVGYLIATPMLIPYSIVVSLMVFSYKLYGKVGKIDGAAGVVISTLLIIGIVLSVVSIFLVILNFVVAACEIIFTLWLAKGMSYKDWKGNTINYGPMGTYMTDKNGNTTHLSN